MQANYVRKQQYKKKKTPIYLLWVEMGHHALALGAPLNGMESFAYGQMEEREGEWHEKKWSQGTHTGSIMIESEAFI